MADKAYSSRANRALLRRRRIQCTIPEKKEQAENRRARGSKGGINLLKQHPAVTTRYEKLAVRCRATVAIAAINIWFR
ncbi:transposase B [Parafrankia sp. EUN1f]|nr:transposase B [Parafrankia sp. EUN1f]